MRDDDKNVLSLIMRRGICGGFSPDIPAITMSAAVYGRRGGQVSPEIGLGKRRRPVAPAAPRARLFPVINSPYSRRSVVAGIAAIVPAAFIIDVRRLRRKPAPSERGTTKNDQRPHSTARRAALVAPSPPLRHDDYAFCMRNLPRIVDRLGNL
jgi:hypothetical protein